MNWTWINKKTTVCPTRQGSGRLREHPTGVGPRFRWDTCLAEDGGFPEKTQRLTMPRAVGPRTDCVTCRPRTGGSAHTSPATSACGLLCRPRGKGMAAGGVRGTVKGRTDPSTKPRGLRAGGAAVRGNVSNGSPASDRGALARAGLTVACFQGVWSFTGPRSGTRFTWK